MFRHSQSAHGLPKLDRFAAIDGNRRDLAPDMRFELRLALVGSLTEWRLVDAIITRADRRLPAQ